MGFWNFITKKSFINMDYVYSTLSNSGGECPFDYKAFAGSGCEFVVVATNAETGEARYFDQRDLAQDHYDVLKASGSIPFVCSPYVIDGVPYYDGALGDPVPIEKAFAMGCEKVVLLLTKPRDYIRSPAKDIKLAAGIRKRYPHAAEKLRQRAENYNAEVALAKEYEKQGRLLIVAPDDTCGVDTLTRDPKAMDRLYEKGRRDAERIPAFLAST